MKKVLAALLCAALVFMSVGSLGAFAEERVLFEDNFENYSEGIFEIAGTAWSAHVKNAEKNAYGFIVSEGGGKVLKFSAKQETYPRTEFNIDASGLADITVSYRVKVDGASNVSLILYTDDAENIRIPAAGKGAWAEFSVKFNLEKLECTVTTDGKAGDPLSLKAISNMGKLNFRLFQKVGEETVCYWDDVKVTTSGGTMELPKEEETLPQKPSYEASTAVKAPFIKGENGKTVMIWKMDDLGSGTFDGFKAIADYCIENGIHASFGAIGKNCESLTDAQFKEIKRWTENGIEIWCHGYNHSINRDANPYIADFQGKTEEEMAQSVSKVIDMFAKYGIEIKSVGAPYNLNDDAFLSMLNNNFAGRITSVMYGKDSKNIFDGYILGNRVNVESSTGVPSLDTFKASYAKATDYPFMVVQAHVGSYMANAEKKTEFTNTCDFIKSEGLITMTPSEYIAYIEEAAKKAEENKSEEAEVIEVIDDSAAGHIRVVIAGSDIDFTKYDSVYPVIENDRTLIPIRAIAEALNADVAWDEATSGITIKRAGSTITMQLDNPDAYIDGVKTTLDVPPATINDRTMVPLRFVGEAFKAEVKYSEK